MLSPHFIQPNYEQNNFYHIPQVIQKLLQTEPSNTTLPIQIGHLDRPYKKIVCLFLDAFGWRFLQEHREDFPFLQEIAQNGHIQKIMSQFPSTTAAHMTSFHTGLAPSQSGIFEWQFYDPKADTLICPLLFANARQRRRDSLSHKKIRPEALFPQNAFYPKLREQNVHSIAYVPASYVRSVYSTRIIQAQERKPYHTLAEGLFNLREHIEHTRGPAYFSFYHADIDTICHRYGPTSPQVYEEIRVALSLIERLLFSKLHRIAHDTLFLLTADHGQVDVSPERTIFLNVDKRFAPLLPMLRTAKNGESIAPVGSARDMFLHVKPECLEDALGLLRQHLEGVAQILKVEDLIQQGFFGPPPIHESLRARAGDLVILPFQGEAVWWYEQGVFEQPFLGHHGGLTPEEMEIPLLAYDFTP
ncbi:MAG: alkaline phosphatase family protein [Myxococcales bacterium]|nr:alkaline phosphatase family protein [Myxococcales bacterium]